MASPWENDPIVGQVNADPIIAPADPYKQSAEARAAEDQQLQREAAARSQAQLQLSQESAERSAAKEQRETQLKEKGFDATEGERKAAAFLIRALGSNTSYENSGVGPRSLIGQAARDTFPDATNYFTDADRQVAESAQDEFIAASLRQDSGAAIPPEEMERQRRIYFPMPGDGPEVLEQKRQARVRAIEGLKQSSGRLLENTLAKWEAMQPQGDLPEPVADKVNQDEGLTGTVSYEGPNTYGPGDNTPFEGQRRFAGEVGAGLDAMATLGKQGITFGLSDEAAGLGGGIANVLQGENFGEGYTSARDAERAKVEAARNALGWGGTALEFAGAGGGVRNAMSGLGRGLQAARSLPQGVPLSRAAIQSRMTRQAATEGAALGATGGFGYGEGAQGSALGAAGGAAFGGALGGIGQRIANRGQANAEGQDLVNIGAREGVRVMTSDVRPPQSFIGKTARAAGERIPFAGTGGPRAAQNAEREAAVMRLADDYGVEVGPMGNTFVDDVAKDLAATRGGKVSALTKRKEAVIQSVGEPFTGAPSATREIDKQIARLSGIDAQEYAPVIDRLARFKQQLNSGKTLEQVEGQRKLLGEMFADPQLAGIRTEGQKAINAVYDPLRTDMGQFIKDKAGQEAFSRWQSSNRQLSELAGDLGNSTFKRMLNNAESTPEDVARLLFSKKPSDVKRLYNNLSEQGQSKARSAIIYQAMEKAGDDVSPKRFANAIGQLSKSIGVAFPEAERVRVMGMKKLLDATQQASVSAAAPPTGVQNTPVIGAIAIGEIAGSGGAATAMAGSIGLLARAYESAPVRNLLLRLGRSKEGSQQERVIISKLSAIISGRTAEMVPQAANSNMSGRLAAEDNQAQ